MINLFSDEMRRNPFPLYQQFRETSPVLQIPPPIDMCMVFDYEGVKRALQDHQAFSSAVPAPKHWFIFMDPPRHSKMRALISRAFTPSVITRLEPRIRQLSRQLLDSALAKPEMDLAADYSIPLPMTVIAEMIGIPAKDWPRFRHWSDEMLKLSYTMRGMEQDPEAASALGAFRTVTAEMEAYLAEMIRERDENPRDDLVTRLVEAEVEGDRLSPPEILGFFQLLIVGGQETTTNLINNAILSLLENPDQLELLRAKPELLPGAIEEVLRYRSPIQWLMRAPRQDVEMNGTTIAAGKLVLAIIGSANRDPKQFTEPEKFDILRNPNPHIAFGHGIHACIGAALARMEARIALADLLSVAGTFQLAGDGGWEPRKALHLHGPQRLPLKWVR